jgi:hypothetical protein
MHVRVSKAAYRAKMVSAIMPWKPSLVCLLPIACLNMWYRLGPVTCSRRIHVYKYVIKEDYVP